MNVLSGDEHLIFDGMPINRLLSDFWKWNSSDLLNNTMRGSFAEFIVATALDLDLTQSHIDWESYDLTGKNGERIEVKCSAYLQSWYPKDNPQKKSRIIFSIAPALEWLADECKYKPNSLMRHSDLYVFCHYKSVERKPENPLNLDNWDFYVLATYKIDAIFGEQCAVSLKSLQTRGNPIACNYGNLSNAIAKEFSDSVKNKKATAD